MKDSALCMVDKINPESLFKIYLTPNFICNIRF